MSKNELSIKEAMEHLFKRYEIFDRYRQRQILDRWETIMGKTIARHTVDIRFHKREMILVIDSAPLRNELHFAREKIMELVNREFEESVIDSVKIIG